ncbi:DctP family TRAP transporter solute-binding subunit [Bacillus chungangensis]|uniref:C4-dicarboxylate-binding protein DctP n=1 Tax=Bacillus chungangensis TaxID=587633 RepID=A0ABT9WNI9_9BACI|nr:DctP family TRAP transporter solute-binding subunit [Bacillus chungangensis]MDQ0174848.1 C4-dicarboxylate-binding protein DctP [Bacillus chungangensis]
MKGIISIISFLLVGIATAIYIGFGNTYAPKPIAVDHELQGLNEKYILKFSHVVAENTPKGIAASRFAQLVKEKTNGWVEVQVFPNGVLNDAQGEFEALKKNEVQIIAPAISEIAVHDPKWTVIDLPFLFENEEMVERAFDGKLGELLFQSIAQYHYKGIAFWDNNFKQFTNNIRPIVTPADLQGLTVRIMPSPLLIDMYQTFGAYSQSFPFNEIYESLRRKHIDGIENTLSNIYSKGLYQQQKYMTVSNHNYLGYAVLMDDKVWDTLPVHHQNSIMEAMEEVTEWLRTYAKEHNKDMLLKVESSESLNIHYLTESERNLWKEALSPIYEKYEPIIGKEIMAEVWKLQEAIR